MVKAIAAAAAAANALGDVTEDPDKKHLYENLSDPERSQEGSSEKSLNNQLVATEEELDLPTVSMLLLFYSLFWFRLFTSPVGVLHSWFCNLRTKISFF